MRGARQVLMSTWKATMATLATVAVVATTFEPD